MSAAQLRLERRDVLVLDEKRFEVVRRGPLAVEIVSTDGMQDRRLETHDQLKQAYFDRRLRIERGTFVRLAPGLSDQLGVPLSCFSLEARAAAMLRLDYVVMCDRFFDGKRAPRTLAGYARVGRLVSWLRRRKAANDAGKRVSTLGRERFGASTLRDWHWRWRDAGRSLNALVPLDYLKGRNTPKTDKHALAVVERHVRDEWLTASCPPLTVVYENIVAEIEQFNRTPGVNDTGGVSVQAMTVPSLSTVSRWVRDNIDDYDAILARHGKKEAERRFHGVRRAPQPIRPLQIVQVDHQLLDIEILDPTSPSGSRRPWLTVAICATTRMIYGFHIGFETPSWLSVMACLKMGALPKDRVIEEGRKGPYPIESDWPVFGLPEVLVVDNGKDFQSNSMKAAAGQLGIELRYTPTRRPHLKGKVERFFGEVARNFLAFMPGRTFANIREKGDYDPKANASLTLPDIRTAFLLWAVDYHHNKPHRGLMLRTPRQAWEDVQGYGVRVAPDAEYLNAFLGLVLDRSIRSKGIEYLGLLYQSHELQLLRRGPGKRNHKWTVKADPFDLSEIAVLDEDGRKWIKVPSTDPELTECLDIRLYRAMLDEVKTEVEAGRNIHVSHLLQARQKLMAIGRDAGVKRFSPPTEIDLDWARVNADMPIVRVDTLRRRARVNPADQQRLENQARRKEIQGQALPPRPVSDAPLPVEVERHRDPAAPSEVAVASRRSGRHRIDPDDPNNWS